MRELLVGCGNNRQKMFGWDGPSGKWDELVTLDIDPNCGADVVWDMNYSPLPFETGSFDALHFYDTLEHWGTQGDWRGFFEEFTEYHRILKPGGSLCVVVPVGADAFADPGHTRFFSENHFYMLDQKWYERARLTGHRSTDYRWFYKVSFEIRHMEIQGGHHLMAWLVAA